MKPNQILDAEIVGITHKPVNLLILPLVLIGIGGFIGATTNLINGNLSPEYFQIVMNWKTFIVWKAILQGIFEGIIYGFIFGLIFTIGFAIITKRKGSWKFAKAQLRKAVVVIYACWIIGGVIAMIWASLLPIEYNNIFHLTPTAAVSRLRFVWVGGSIWGQIVGGGIAVIYGLISTYRNWKKEL